MCCLGKEGSDSRIFFKQFRSGILQNSMPSLIHREKLRSALFSILLTVAIACLYVSLSTQGLKEYGAGLFFASPLVCGFVAVYSYNRSDKKPLRDSLSVATIAGFVSLFGFLVVGLEGLICIVMAIPVVIPLFLVGGLMGYAVSKATSKKAPSDVSTLILIVAVPLLMGFEAKKSDDQQIRKAVTRVVISASIDKVWDEVIQFSTIPEPTEILFRMGIAYPTSARIEGKGVGAIRYCTFSTGSFVEPITHWEKNHKLAFDVSEQPTPMTEVSPYTGIHPPHLDWAVRSIKGQFVLKESDDGMVELEGTTWFHTEMKPEPYWSFIAEEMIHLIHHRVLNHIKNTIEDQSKTKEEI